MLISLLFVGYKEEKNQPIYSLAVCPMVTGTFAVRTALHSSILYLFVESAAEPGYRTTCSIPKRDPLAGRGPNDYLITD